MSEHEDQLAAMRAVVDRAVEAANELARGVYGYFAALVDQGMTRDEALQCAIAWQSMLLTLPPSEDA